MTTSNKSWTAKVVPGVQPTCHQPISKMFPIQVPWPWPVCWKDLSNLYDYKPIIGF